MLHSTNTNHLWALHPLWDHQLDTSRPHLLISRSRTTRTWLSLQVVLPLSLYLSSLQNNPNLEAWETRLVVSTYLTLLLLTNYIPSAGAIGCGRRRVWYVAHFDQLYLQKLTGCYRCWCGRSQSSYLICAANSFTTGSAVGSGIINSIF